MEVPYLGIQKSDPANRQFVYCISHSRWNDGFASQYKFSYTKRSVIEQDVHWVQIQDQNRRLSFGRYGQPSTPKEFAPYFWMRNSHDAKVHWLWERMLVSTRPDPSDAGMTWFLVTGDEECDPTKLKRLIAKHALLRRRSQHENRCGLKPRTSATSMALHWRTATTGTLRNVSTSSWSSAATGSIRTPFDEPFTSDIGHYDVDIRYLDVNGSRARFALFVNRVAQGGALGIAGRRPWLEEPHSPRRHHPPRGRNSSGCPERWRGSRPA